MKIEHIEWVDSRQVDPAWHTVEGFPDEELFHLYSVGFVAHEDDNRVILVCSYDPHMENVSSGIIIPKSAVVKRKILRN